MNIQVLKKKNTERTFVYFAQFSPKVTFCKMVVSYHHQDIDIKTTHWSHSDLLRFTFIGVFCKQTQS